MVIRRATVTDVDSMCRVDARAFGSGDYAAATDATPNANWREKRAIAVRESTLKLFGKSFVAIIDGEVVGFVMYDVFEGPEEHWLVEHNESTGVIRNNAVDPDYQGQGISSRLLQTAVSELISLGVKRIRVHTAHVPAAVRVYQKIGFDVVDHPGAGRTILEMSWLESRPE